MILQINLNIYIYTYFLSLILKFPFLLHGRGYQKDYKEHSIILGRAHTKNHVKMSIWVLSFQTGLKNINILKLEQVKKEDSCVAFNWLWE